MFLLFLMGLGAASVKAQVRIGGNGAPNAAAVLDLNANDDATPAGNKGALALPRVSLASTTAQLNGTTPLKGMMVYNTGGTLGAGVYYWDGVLWVAVTAVRSYTVLTLVLDTSFVITNIGAVGAANSWARVAAPSLRQSDICYNASTGGLHYDSENGFLFWCNVVGAAVTPYNAHAICYRPTLVP